jgi:hypothetical protein
MRSLDLAAPDILTSPDIFSFYQPPSYHGFIKVAPLRYIGASDYPVHSGPVIMKFHAEKKKENMIRNGEVRRQGKKTKNLKKGY